MDMPDIYRVEGDSVQKYSVVYNTDEYTYVIPINALQKFKTETLYTKKRDARYELFVKRMRNGTILANYKKSKYYEYYIERARVEHPELLI